MGLFVKFFSALHLLAAMFAFATGASADELLALAGATSTPRRFQRHAPEFRVVPANVDYWAAGTVRQRQVHFILDGARYVAVFDPKFLCLDVVAFAPAEAPAHIDLPMDYSPSRPVGTRISACTWYDHQERPSSDRHRHTFTTGEGQVELVVSESWSRQRKADSTHRLRLRVDPVFGYVWDIRVQLTTSDNRSPVSPDKTHAPEVVNLQQANLTNPWPGQARFNQTVFTPRGRQGTFTGWWNNLAAMDRSDQSGLRVREGGFVAWMGGEKWGVALAHLDMGGADSYNITGAYWGRQHQHVVLPGRPARGIPVRIDTRWRLQGLPPEIVAAVLEQAVMNDFGGWREPCIGIGMTEDFEDQPLPLTTPTRGCWGPGLRFSHRRSRSGGQSLRIDAVPPAALDWGTGRFVAPYVPLEPRTGYLLEAWVWVEEEGTVAYVAEGNPKNEEWLVGRRQTNRAKGGGNGWQKVSLRFTTGKEPSDADVRFIAVGKGAVYFDDFRLVEATAP
jgi:hypothetical protein